ncbi:MAG: methionine synthase [Planctomycetota bacterium]|jgi:5-methyltetrahydrofolate--homocysteine methyltransferase
MSDLLRRLKEGVLVFDGAMGTSLQELELTAEDFGGLEGCNENLVFTRPDALEQVHAGFLEAGCDILETDTFGGTPRKLGEYGLGDRVHEQNKLAAEIARRVADRFSTTEQPRFVSGSMGPTGLLPASEDPDLGGTPISELSAEFEAQALGLLAGGVDVLQVETTQDILEAKAAVLGIRRAFSQAGRRVPLIVQVTLDPSGRMLLGTDILSALVTVESLGADIVGLNCSTGPEEMRDAVRTLCDRSVLPVSVLPNAGLPLNVDGKASYPMTPEPFARALGEFIEDFGVNLVGGCCGTTPTHLVEVVKAVRAAKKRKRTPQPADAVSSMMTSAALVQQPAPTLVGERVNSQGSRKMKRLLLKDDYESIVDIAREQHEGGAHILDVCVALTERTDEKEQMVQVLRKIALAVPLPVCIDSTEPDVIRAALEIYPGRCLVNSINMENGRERIDAIVPSVKEFGAALVALTIDPVGMAKTRERKLEVAKAIHDIVVDEYGIPPGDLVFDCLTFTLATGDEEFLRSAEETIEGIRAVKENLPGVRTILGVSNVSFGLGPEARKILNSVMLYHCVQAGLDMAIVNPREITPYSELSEEERELADDMVFARREDALPRFIDYCEKRAPSAHDAEAEKISHESPEAHVHWCILHRKPDGIEDLLDRCLENQSPVDVLNKVLLPAMKEVGDKFGSGELILPFVLQSAEVMKRAVKHVEQFLDKADGASKGTVVVATVFGDVHDIGKNLVRTILGNNGYDVHDLGKQVPAHTIVDKAIELKADVVGLSALLVSTSRQMPVVVKELHRKGVEVPVLIGGAAINRPFGKRANSLDEDTLYPGGVFYCKDAFEGLETADRLRDPDEKAEAIAAVQAAEPEAVEGTHIEVKDQDSIPRSKVRDDVEPPTPPFTGARVLEDIDLRDVFPLISERSLYHLSWGVRHKDPEERKRLIAEEFAPLRTELEAECIEKGLLQPQAIYGFWPCVSEKRDLVVLDPADTAKQLARLTFPRQPGGKNLCLPDYFASRERGVLDVIGLQCVTVGREIAELTEQLSKDGDYTRSYHLHGLAVQAAEALAEYTHRHIRRELGLEDGRGLRYSPGYPACPDLAQHVPMFELLGVDAAIGASLTEAHQIDPEASTAAFVLHHPDAEYYHTKGSGAI